MLLASQTFRGSGCKRSHCVSDMLPCGAAFNERPVGRELGTKRRCNASALISGPLRRLGLWMSTLCLHHEPRIRADMQVVSGRARLYRRATDGSQSAAQFGRMHAAVPEEGNPKFAFNVAIFSLTDQLPGGAGFRDIHKCLEEVLR